uniref:PiggyBac transposable element-derived protein domain-containing protein n=1 Tax=Glossina pallidipes TaxID=7398 RepID=A0A1B0A7A7_GLOPL
MKTETIAYYSGIKFRVDLVDHMTRKYTTKAASFRWPVRSILPHFRFSGNKRMHLIECTGSKLSRKDFLFHLAKEGEKEKYKNIDYNHPSPSSSEERKTCQIGFYKRSNNTCKICEKK